MKILHTADWHIGQFKGPVEDGVNLRSLDTIKCLEYMVKVAEEEKPDMVCISGDIFHQEQIGPVRYSDEMVTATRIIEGLAERSKFVVVMRGTPNHDGAGQFRVLEKMLSKNKKIAVVTTPQVISTPIADVACIPGFDKQEFRAKFPGLSAEEENLTWTKYISDTFKLKHNQNVKFTGLPVGTKISVTESAAPNYKGSAAVVINGTTQDPVTATKYDEALTVSDKSLGQKKNTVDVTNTYDYVPTTGIIMNTLPYVLMIALCGAALIAFVAFKRRRLQK